MPKKTTQKSPRSPRKKAPAKGKATKASAKARTPGRRASLGTRLVVWSLTLMIWAGIGVGGILVYYAYDLPDIHTATTIERRAGITIAAADGTVLASRGDLFGATVQLRDLPQSLPQAVLATEDRRFYDHFGVDVFGLARAMFTNVMAGEIRQGGSTITQQVAKNLFLTSERSYERKIKEVLLAFWLEHEFSKDQILTLYLNRVYLGGGTYGVEAASRKYFGKGSRHLGLYESAMLAGLLKAPSRYNPARNPDLAAQRTNVVLNAMVDAGYLNDAQVAEAKRYKSRTIATARPYKSGQYFVDWVMEQAAHHVGPGPQDITVITTLNPRIQKLAEREMSALIRKHGKARKVSQGAMVILSPDGAVRAMVGGSGYSRSQFNRATQALRQPGSAFKPFVYLAALEAGQSANTVFRDAPVTVQGWTPENYGGTYKGAVTMHDAMAASLNTVAVQAAQHAGVKSVAKAARRLGVTTPLKTHPSLALGASEVSVLELTSAYASFANGGYGVFAFGIEEIRDENGFVLFQRHGNGSGRVISRQHTAEMNSMLSGVMDTGTGQKAAFAGRDLAGKTGTSQGFRDAWFIGYSADLVGGVWLGNDDGAPMDKVTGGSLPAELWRDVMSGAHERFRPRTLAGLERQEASLETILRNVVRD